MISVNKGFPIFRTVKFLLLTLTIFTFSVVRADNGRPEEGTTTHAQDQHGTEHPSDLKDEAPHGDASHAKAPAGYDAKGVIMHHIGDAHDWHFFSFGHTDVNLPLPVIVYSKENGLDIFLSSKFKAKGDGHDHDAPKHYKNYILFHEKIYLANANGELTLDEHHHATNETPLDISITKNVAQMILALIILCAIFITVANAYVKKGRWVPKGIQSFMEPLILFVRDDIVRPNMGKNADRFMPYMLSLFFFIWVSNLLGLLPGSANVTGNIAVTAALALLTLLVTNLFGNKAYWGHIFMPPGVPLPLYIIMIPVEIIGIFTKPFALMIRLFANITAGHIIILSVLGLIFMFSNGGANTGAGFGVALPSMLLTLFLFCLELLVAFLQAFIFTMLSSLFIGQAMEDHGHHAHEEGHGAHH